MLENILNVLAGAVGTGLISLLLWWLNERKRYAKLLERLGSFENATLENQLGVTINTGSITKQIGAEGCSISKQLTTGVDSISKQLGATMDSGSISYQLTSGQNSIARRLAFLYDAKKTEAAQSEMLRGEQKELADSVKKLSSFADEFAKINAELIALRGENQRLGQENETLKEALEQTQKEAPGKTP